MIAVRCRHASDDAMFFVRVQLKLADGTQKIIVTDNSWRCSAKPARGLDRFGLQRRWLERERRAIGGR